ncbi:MAG: trigger factor [Candidatus Paceibacterota bacterium]|jgi:trigger factor
MKIEKKNLPKSEVEFKIVVDEKELEAYHAQGLSTIQQVVEVDGFRKGNAPEDLIVKKYGDMIILEEMANFALRDAYTKAIDEHKITPISQPAVTITKLAKGNPLELTITVPVMPEVTLPKYKEIAKGVVKADIEKVEVTDKDIDDVIEELRKGRATQHTHEHGENCDHEHEEETKEEAVLPEINDEFARSFGDNFKSLVDLRAKVGENLKLEKEQKLREKRRGAIMEKLIAESKADLPDVIVESELNTMLAQMKQDITRFGGTWEEYLSHSNKTEDEIKSDWKNDAVKRAMSQLILHKIAEVEKLTPTPEEVEVQLVHLLSSVQDADEERAKSYLYQALTNENVLKFLEGKD